MTNMIEAFALLKKSVQEAGLRNAVRAYNGSGPAAEAYANEVLANEQKWAKALGKPSMQGH
jgi:hypothetical protein